MTYAQSMKKLDDLLTENTYEEAVRLHKIWLHAVADNERFYEGMTEGDREQFDYIFGNLEL